MIDILENLGKGLLPQPADERDFQYHLLPHVAGAAPVVFTTTVFSKPEPPNEDQGSSSSCVAQSTSYFHWQINGYNWSRRDLYSRIYLPAGGAYLRDGVSTICSTGQATRDVVSDPSPQTEDGMRSRANETSDLERVGLEANYYAINAKDIYAVAQAIRDEGGCIFGVQGDNKGWADIANPTPPVMAEWGHALYGFGYHEHDGKQCIIAKSSWGDTGNTTVHHIKVDYFTSGNTFDGWVLIPKEQDLKLVNNNGTYSLEGELGHIGISKVEFLDELLKITKKVEARPVAGIQVGVIETLNNQPNEFVIKAN